MILSSTFQVKNRIRLLVALLSFVCVNNISFAENSFDALPAEMLESIFIHLSPLDVETVARVDRRFRSVVLDSPHLKKPFNFISIPQDLPNYQNIAGPIYSVFVNQGKIYLGTRYGLSISEDFGETFKTITPTRGLCGGTIDKIYVDAKKIYVRCEYFIRRPWVRHHVYYSDDGGESFSRLQQSGNPVETIPMRGPKKFHWRGNNTIQITQDGGQSWTAFSRKTLSIDYESVQKAHADGNIIVMALDDGISVSRDGGKTFKRRKMNEGSQNYQYINHRMLVRDGKLLIAGRSGITFLNPVDQNFLLDYLRGPQPLDMGANDNSIFVTSYVDGLHVLGEDGKFQRHPFFDKHADLGNVYISNNNVFITAGFHKIVGIWASLDGGKSFQKMGYDGTVKDLFFSGERIYVNAGASTHPGTNIQYSVDDGNHFQTCHLKFQNERIEGKKVYFLEDGHLFAMNEECEKLTEISVGPPTKKSKKITAFQIDQNRLLVAVNYEGDNQLYGSQDEGQTFHQVSNDFELHGPPIEQIEVDRGSIYLRSAAGIRVNLGSLRVFKEQD
jgi:hypothetical protein